MRGAVFTPAWDLRFRKDRAIAASLSALELPIPVDVEARLTEKGWTQERCRGHYGF